MSSTRLELLEKRSGNGHIALRGDDIQTVPVGYELAVYRQLTEALPGQWIDTRLKVIRGTVRILNSKDLASASQHESEYFTLMCEDRKTKLDFSFQDPAHGTIATIRAFYS